MAVFRELYDSEKDVYGIIACFLKEIIVTNSKHQFNLFEITSLLNDSFNFCIPEAVVRTSLGRLDFIEKKDGKYLATLSNVGLPSINSKKDEKIKNNEKIINELLLFIEKQKKKKLSNEQKEKVIHSFCSFMLDKSNDNKYSEYIGAFIINKEQESDFTKQLNDIKEGVVLYTGIMFNDNINNLGSWNTELTIFLETEILFNFAGYDGEIYKKLFDDFFSFAKEINAKASRDIVKLKYFKEVKSEIENFFKKAEHIVEGKDIVQPQRTAMVSIVNGCKSKSDVLAKKALFYKSLESNSIVLDDYEEYFEDYNHKYNIVDEKTIEIISNSSKIGDVSKHLNFLNYINILRKESGVNNFENIGYILLTGNYTTIQIAWHEKIKPESQVPLATSLDFLTNKFWFKLNKGFGENQFPKTFNVISKAQRLLSSQLKKAVGQNYDSLKKDLEQGKISEEDVIVVVAELKKQSKKPEDINKGNVSDILDSISSSSVEKIMQEQELFKQKAKKHKEENIVLKENLDTKIKKIDEKNIIIKNQSEQKEKITQATIVKVAEMKIKQQDEKHAMVLNLEKIKEPIDKKIKNVVLIKYKLFPTVLFVAYIFLLIFIFNLYGWDKMEFWMYILGLLILSAPVLYYLYTKKTFSIKNILEEKILKYELKKYKDHGFDLTVFNRLSVETKKIKKKL